MKKILIILYLTIHSALLSGQNTELIPVAKLHYTNEEIKELLPVDIEKINYYYSETFIVDTTHPLYEKFVSQYCRDGIFDITNFENFRYYDTYHTYTKEDYYGFTIILTPWSVIEKKYIEIENKYN